MRRHDRGGDQPLGPGDVEAGAPLEVGGARLLRPEVAKFTESVLVQQLCYLGGQEAGVPGGE